MMHSTTPVPSEDDLIAAAVEAREAAWRVASGLLVTLVILNTGMVLLTLGRFGVAFFISNGINGVLAWGLNRTKPWARVATIVWEAIGIGLAVAVAIQSGATSDLLVTALLQGGILLPLIGPPHKAKSAIGILLFVFGFILAAYALLTQRVIVR